MLIASLTAGDMQRVSKTPLDSLIRKLVGSSLAQMYPWEIDIKQSMDYTVLHVDLAPMFTLTEICEFAAEFSELPKEHFINGYRSSDLGYEAFFKVGNLGVVLDTATVKGDYVRKVYGRSSTEDTDLQGYPGSPGVLSHQQN